jgi:hypothetical protein
MRIYLVKDVKGAITCGLIIALILTIVAAGTAYLAAGNPGMLGAYSKSSAGFVSNPLPYLPLLFLKIFIWSTIAVFAIYFGWDVIMSAIQFFRDNRPGNSADKTRKNGTP